MGNAQLVLQYCKIANKPLTAMQIIDACFPGKSQPYINGTINKLVQDKQLIRNDNVLPYTVRVPDDGEDVPQPKDYSKGYKGTKIMAYSNLLHCSEFTEADLEETAQRVNVDPRYGEEGMIIESCFNEFPKNNVQEVIALKIALIDMTNSTNLNKHLGKIHLSQLIEKIMGCNFDERVKNGDSTLVGELARGEVNLFSFFSKYSLYHNYYVYQKDDFAIFDGVMQRHLGRYLSSYIYLSRMYPGAKLHNCIEKMRTTYDYDGYLKLIDTILDNNDIYIPDRRRKFDWFVWYNNRK